VLCYVADIFEHKTNTDGKYYVVSQSVSQSINQSIS